MKVDEVNQTIGALRFVNNFLAERTKKLEAELSQVKSQLEKTSNAKFDESNQTIGALWFENNFLAEKTKKLVAELFQVRAQLERTSSAKLDEILNF